MRNLELMGGVNMGGAVMIEPARRCAGGQGAHEIVRTAAMEALESDRHMRDVLVSLREVTGLLALGRSRVLLSQRGLSGLLWNRWRVWWGG